MRDEIAARLSRDRQDDFSRRLGEKIVDRLRGDYMDMADRGRAYRALDPTAAGAVAEEIRAEELGRIGQAIDWLTADPKGQRWEPPAPRAPKPEPTRRFPF